jgi:hypothetical protein
MTQLLRTPRTASDNFSIDAGTHPRQRHTFYVDFIRSGANQLARTMRFNVKSIDRPSVQPITEELNQYNKKRQIHTGWKGSPVKISFYDTTDGRAMRLFDDYMRFYFGDFNQGESVMWQYDVTMPDFSDNGSGFGFTAEHGGAGVRDVNSQFYFEQINVVQVSGTSYEMWSLVHPRISSYDPDDLDYENSSAAMITMTFAYEAILYRGGPITLEIASEFQDSGVLQVTGPPQPQTTTNYGDVIPASGNAIFAKSSGFLDGNGVYRSRGGQTSGALGIFGQFNFADIAGSVVDGLVSGRGISGGLANLPYTATSNPVISTILNSAMGRSQNPLAEVGTAVLGQALRPQGGLPAALWDAAQAGIQGSTRGRTVAQGNAAGALARGVVASVLGGGAGATRTATGVTVPNSALGAVNAVRPSYAQYGFRTGR